MRIREFVWPQERIEHIASHGIDPWEVEQVCFGSPLVLRAKSEGENPAYYVNGQTAGGRYLFCVVLAFPDGKGYPVTARTMTAKAKRDALVSIMGKAMKAKNLPKTDSIEALARFWGGHDVTEFQEQLEEVKEPAFKRSATAAPPPPPIRVRLSRTEANEVRRLAKSAGVSQAVLIRKWVRQQIKPRGKSGRYRD